MTALREVRDVRRAILALVAALALAFLLAGTVGVVYGAYLDSQSACPDRPQLATERVSSGPGDADVTAFEALNDTQQDRVRLARNATVGVREGIANSLPAFVRWENATYQVVVSAPTCRDRGLVFKALGFGSVVLGLCLFFGDALLWLRDR